MNIGLDDKKVVLGISGGVDSTTAALLLLEKGYEVYGLYFNIHEDGEEGRAAALNALVEAYKAVNAEISTEAVETKYFIYRDINKIFNDIVISDFCNEYLNGRTPNPCIVCNPAIKFKLLLEAANEVGAAYIATGHYADTFTDETSGISYIRKTASKKDQSYMLYRLPQEIVSRVMFPLADFSDKSEIRAIADANGMSNASKSDSQEICFIEDGVNHAEFIREWVTGGGCSSATGTDASDLSFNLDAAKSTVDDACSSDQLNALNSGNFVDNTGKVLGKHKGIANYTIGQRKGLGIALGKPAFVTEINPENNTVVLGENDELFKTHVIIDNLFFAETNENTIPKDIEKMQLTAKVRYAAPQAAAKVAPCTDCNTYGACDASNDYNGDSRTLLLTFETPQRAMTPGQSVVIYRDDLVIGGGRIVKTY